MRFGIVRLFGQRAGDQIRRRIRVPGLQGENPEQIESNWMSGRT
ncbi:hypothetical protein [Nisaea sp.]